MHSFLHFVKIPDLWAKSRQFCAKQCCHLSKMTNIDQNRTKNGPLLNAKSDLFQFQIRTNTIKSVFYQLFKEDFWLFEPCISSKAELNACLKRPIFSMLSSIFSQIRTFWCKSGPFPDQLLQKSPDQDQSQENTDQMGALQVQIWTKKGAHSSILSFT